MTAAYRIETKSPEVTQEVGRVLGVEARPGDIFLLTGPLGAGKTCLTQGIARGLGVEGYVRSPTFVLMTRYSGRLTLHHVDLYRIGEPIEAWDLGLEEQLFSDGICVVELECEAKRLCRPHVEPQRTQHGIDGPVLDVDVDVHRFSRSDEAVAKLQRHHRTGPLLGNLHLEPEWQHP